MMTSSHLPAESLQRWRELAGSDQEAALSYYFDNLLQANLEYLEALPCHRELRATAYGTLVSLMGFSPETTVTSAVLLRPKLLVIVSSSGATESLELAHTFLTSRKILRVAQIKHETVEPTDPVSIYDEIERYLPYGEGQ